MEREEEGRGGGEKGKGERDVGGNEKWIKNDMEKEQQQQEEEGEKVKKKTKTKRERERKQDEEEEIKGHDEIIDEEEREENE